MAAAEMTERLVPAPNKVWLSEAEVLSLLGDISSKTLERMMRDGRFPRPTPWGRDSRWRWEAVTWYHLGKMLAPSLTTDAADESDPAETTDGQPDDNAPTTRRQRGVNARQPGADA